MRRIWRQGEHVALIGPTGCGKTTLARELLPVRSFVVVLAIKTRDDTLESYKRQGGYKVIREWPPQYNDRRVILWLKPESLDDVALQRSRISQAMQQLYIEGGWCVYLDDLSYIVEHYGLRSTVTAFLNQGRSSGLSVVSAMQRPRRVPLEAFNQARHVVVWPFDDRQEVARVAEIAGYPARELEAMLGDVGQHDCIALTSRRAPIIVEG